MTVGDAALRKIIGRHFQHDPISRKNTDEVQTHLSRNVGEHSVAVVQFNSEHGVRKQLDDLSRYFDSVFLGHVNTSG